MIMISNVQYPVKIHLPGCKCNHYRKKSRHKTQILVSPYKKEDFKKRYYIYDSIETFNLDKHNFVDNCVCTFSDGIYNGGVVILSNTPYTKLSFNDTNELINLHFIKLKEVYNIEDSSGLINNFFKIFPSLYNMYILIGETIQYDETIPTNYTLPKGKVIMDETSEECCYREFTEETDCVISDKLKSDKYQLAIRKEKKLLSIPFDIIINRFLLKIIIV